MSTSKPFSALILAGGQSSRMGQDKALLQLNGQSLLAHMQQLALATGASEVLISRNKPGFIQDAPGQFGPLAGILAALKHCTSSHLLVLPIDTPRLNVTSLKLLLQNTDGTASYFAHSPLPCVLPVTAALSTIITKQLQQGLRSVKGLLAQFNAIAVPISPNELLNTNTPQDWQLCLDIFSHGNLYAKA